MFFSQNTQLPRKACSGWLHFCVQTHFSDTHGRAVLQALEQKRETLALHNTQNPLQAVLRAWLASHRLTASKHRCSLMG